MATSDAFALRNSGLDAFLFAEVGEELNGLPLTILSVLARLGKDPWAEAAKWVSLPKAATIDRLTQSISQMPLSPEALNDARATASRLILLLPAQASAEPQRQGKRQNEPIGIFKKSLPRWALIAICAAAIGLGFTYNVVTTSSHNDTIVPLNPTTAPAPPSK